MSTAPWLVNVWKNIQNQAKSNRPVTTASFSPRGWGFLKLFAARRVTDAVALFAKSAGLGDFKTGRSVEATIRGMNKSPPISVSAVGFADLPTTRACFVQIISYRRERRLSNIRQHQSEDSAPGACGSVSAVKGRVHKISSPARRSNFSERITKRVRQETAAVVLDR